MKKNLPFHHHFSFPILNILEKSKVFLKTYNKRLIQKRFEKIAGENLSLTI